MDRSDLSPIILIVILAIVGSGFSTRCPAQDRQSASAAQGGKSIKSKSSEISLVLIPTGAFEMGSQTSEDGHSRAETPHIVRMTQAFYMGVSEVTQAEYESVMKSNPSAFSSTGSEASKLDGIKTARFPVENVSWFDAVEFCNKLSEKDELKPHYGLTAIEREDGSIKSAVVSVASQEGYRLPSEAEWEYACRAGTVRTYSSGNSVAALDEVGWYGTSRGAAEGSDKHPHPVRRKPSNTFGLFDMHGNVAEWCQDWYDYNYYERAPTNDPPGPLGGSSRVIRGGSWSDDAIHCRAASREGYSPMRRESNTGFRIVLSYFPPARTKTRTFSPPFRIVVDRRDGRTLDLFNEETYDSIESAKQRLAGAKLVGNLGSIRIIDSNGDKVE